MDDYVASPYAYCLLHRNFFEIYNYETGELVNSIMLDNSNEQSITSIYNPTPTVQASH